MIKFELKPFHSRLDSTKIQDAMRCYRYYFYKYILGWVPDRPELHLDFGRLWHKSMEHLILNGQSAKTVLEAYDILNSGYREIFPEESSDSDRAPKTPGTILANLPKYSIFCKSQGDNFKPVYTEIGGSVPISESNRLYFRMDSILQNLDNGKFLSLEHKTGSQLSEKWKNNWKLKFQTGTYNHVLHCLYKDEEIEGVYINGAIFTKGRGIDYLRVPVRKSVEMLEVWLKQANWYYEGIIVETEHFLDELSHDLELVMQCFQQNTESCTDYSGCEYFNFCTAWPNPLRHIEEIPEGFRQKFWDPTVGEVDLNGVALREDKARKIFEL
jgi:hypothetical protein